MEDEKKKSETAAIVVLIFSTLIQFVTLMFLWNRERFNENWERVKNVFKKDKDDS